MARVSAATLAANPNPQDLTDHVKDSSDGNGAAAAPAAPTPEAPPPRRRGRRPAAAKQPTADGATPSPSAPLTEDELAAIGVLTVRAARAGLPIDDYASELRVLLQAYDRMQADVASQR